MDQRPMLFEHVLERLNIKFQLSKLATHYVKLRLLTFTAGALFCYIW